MADRYARCPRCGNDDLLLTETHEEHGWSFGRHRVQRDGLVPATNFDFDHGDPIRVTLTCEECGHEWRSRRWVTTPDPEAER